MRSITKKLIASAGVGAITVMSQGALAQGDVGRRTVDVLVVEAQRREQNINDVPISITAFGADDIDSYNITDLSDYALLSPNLGFSSDGSPLAPNVNIRGVENIGGIVNSIGIYLDEINTTPSLDIFAYDANLYDIERIEVLRGPQGTLFGRNVLGGVINISTVKPNDEFGGRIDAQYGSFDYRRIKGSLNVPLTDNVFVRGTFLYDARDGWIENFGPQDTTNDYRTLGGRVALRAELTPDTTLDIAGSYSDFEMGFPDAIPDGTSTDFFEFVLGVTGDPDGDYASVGFYPDNIDQLATNRPFFRNRQVTFINGRLEHDFGPVVGIFNAGYINAEIEEAVDGDLLPTDYFTEEEEGEVTSYSLEARLQSNGDGRLNWVAGASYANDESRFTQTEIAYENLLVSAGFPPFLIVPELIVADESFISEIESWGVFADLTYQLDTDGRWTVSVGGRYSEDTVTDFNQDNPNDNNGFTANTFGPESASFATFTARASIIYALTDSVNVYGAVSRGTKPGGFNLRSAQSAAVPETYDIESLLNYEIGTKGTLFDDRMAFSLSAFYMDWTDLQFEAGLFLPTSVAPENVTLNAGKASSYGVEADFSLVVTDNLTVNGGFGYLNAELGDGDDVDPAVDAVGALFNIDGNALPRSPNWSFNLAAEYTKPLTSDFEGFFRVEGSYRTEQFESVDNGESSFSEADPANLLPNLIPAYGILNVRLGARNDSFSLTVYGENLINDTEVIGIRNAVSLIGYNQAFVRRQFGVRGTYDF